MKSLEDIITEKEYFELTPDERLLVEEVAENEREYGDLKIMLLESTTFFKERKVVASAEMRAHIMEKLYPPTDETVMWYQNLWVFLFPPKKSFYQYPAFQLMSILVLFMGIFALWQNPFQDEKLAQNVQVSAEKNSGKDISKPEQKITLPGKEIKSIDAKAEVVENVPYREPEEIMDESVAELDAAIAVEEQITIGDAITNGTANYSITPQSVVSDIQPLDLEMDKYKISPLSNNEKTQADIAVDFDDLSVANRDEKEAASQTLSEVSIESSKSIKLFENKRDKSMVSAPSKKLTASLNMTEIKGLDRLFFEVK